jgi:adenylate cyclase
MTIMPAHPINRFLDLGTAGYPQRIRRRLKILNAVAALIVVSSTLYALTYALSDPRAYRWLIIINLGLIAVALSIPALHRVNEICAGLVLGITECVALFGLVALLGRESGIQLNMIVGAAASFFILGTERVRLGAVMIALFFALHVAAWLMFPAAVVPVSHGFLVQLYLSSALTTFAIIVAIVHYALRLAERAEAETEALLRNILPGEIVDRLRAHPTEPIADAFSEASILFSDIQSFVPLSRRLGAERTVAMLNDMMSRFDALASKHGVEKIKTIGDAYMAVAGLPQPAPDHAARLARMALQMFAEKEAVAQQFGVTIRMRIGIASGPVMAGVIGTRKFSYDVWGDAVNLAARLESSGEPERVQLSAEAFHALAPHFECERRGEIEIKGIGPLETWFLTDRHAQRAA